MRVRKTGPLLAIPLAWAAASIAPQSWAQHAERGAETSGENGDESSWKPARHWLGMELGGTAAAQAVWKVRVIGPAHLQLGAFAGPEYFNGSAGVRIHVLDHRAWGWSLGAGVGGMGVIGFAEPCTESETPCESAAPSSTWGFGWLMAAVDTAIGNSGRSRLGCEAGMWIGSRNEVDSSGRETSERVLMPMVGATLLFAL